MAKFSPKAKDSAKKWRKFSLGVSYSAGALGTVAHGTIVGAPVGLVLYGLGLVAGAQAAAQDRIAHDPPRGDFETETVLAGPFFAPLALSQHERVDAAAVRALEIADDVYRIFNSLVIAVERSQGAQQANRPDARRAREYEAVGFAGDAVWALRAFSDAAYMLGDALSEAGSEASDFTRDLRAYSDASVAYANEIDENLQAGTYFDDLGEPETIEAGTSPEEPVS
jgi:hypothetical protein